MKTIFITMAAFALLGSCSIVKADVFNLGAGYTSLDMVTVGDAGNAADNRYGGSYGSVSYTYQIGKYEVTIAQYCDFLNNKEKSDVHGLFSTSMYGMISRSGADGSYVYSTTADWANKPVMQVTFWDACRFCNWLNNGQGDGDTETGAYTLDGYAGTDGSSIHRNSGAKYFLPSEDEWYKAAYYKGGGANAGYWDYPTQSDSIPSNDLNTPDGGNNANFNQNGYTIGGVYYKTDVGEFENSASAYGTFDQGGNVWELNEALPYLWFRGRRGGSAWTSNVALAASLRAYYPPDSEADSIGFRVAAAVPEPSSILALLSGLGGLIGLFGVNKLKR